MAKKVIPLLIVILVPLLGREVVARSMDISSLQKSYSDRHFDEIQLSGGTTHYQVVGSGPAVILIHGVSGPMAVWDKAVPALVNAGYKVIRYDLFGRGFSARPDTAYDLELYEQQLIDLIKALNLGPRIRLVGSSLGAIISTEFALRHPDIIDSLILIGPAGFPITVPLAGRLRDAPVIGSIVTFFMAYKTILKQNDHYFVSGRVPDELRPYIADQLSVPGTTDAIVRTMKKCPVQTYVESYRKLSAVKFQVGLIWGRQDATFPYDNSKTLLEIAPRSKLVTVENSGHIPQYERPTEVNKSLIQFENEAH